MAWPPRQCCPSNGRFGFNPAAATIKELYDQGRVEIINGICYPNPNRSHFCSMDIWHTSEPDKVGTDGWLGRVIRDLDPNAENVLTGVNFGRGLPRALSMTGLPVAFVADLASCGVLTGISGEAQREEALDVFARMYGPPLGAGAVMDYLGQTGLDALKGADILKTAPERYQTNVEYAASPTGNNLQGIAKVPLADLGTRIFYTQHAGYDTHANETQVHSKLWTELSQGITDFYDDLKSHDASETVLMFVFTEFGRRVRDNGSGTDHGSGGLALAIGDQVRGGSYGEFPSLKPEDLLEGDLNFSVDFRGVYGTMVERWLGLDAEPVVGGNFEQLGFV